MPFLTVLDPATVARQIRSLIDTYEHLGWLPDCRMTLNKGYTQGGSNADNVLADAYLKGIEESVDWDKGYEAVVKDAEVEPYDWCCEGRGGLDSWKSLGREVVTATKYTAKLFQATFQSKTLIIKALGR